MAVNHRTKTSSETKSFHMTRIQNSFIWKGGIMSSTPFQKESPYDTWNGGGSLVYQANETIEHPLKFNLYIGTFFFVELYIGMLLMYKY